MDEIFPEKKNSNGILWVSDIDTVREESLETYRGSIDTVVSVCQDNAYENISDDTRVAHFTIADGEESQKEWGGSHEYPLFEAAADFVVNSIERGERVIVHCHHGRSRSVAVCAAALGHVYGVDYETALDAIESARPQANPNENMENHAKRYIEE